MARIRSIKPEFWSSEQVMSCTIPARLLFIGLWNFCDDCGHHPLAPNQIKALIFPSDSLITTEVVQGMIDELSVNGLVMVYVVAGRKYLEITGWHHQKIDKPQKPKFPLPIGERSTNPQGTFAAERNTECRIDRNGTEPDKDEIKERVAPSLDADVVGSKAKETSAVAEESCPRSIASKNTLIDPKYRPPEHLIGQCHHDGATDAVIDEEVNKFIHTNQAKGAFSQNWDASWSVWWSRWKEYRDKEAAKVPTRVEMNSAGRAALGYKPTEAEFDRATGLFAKSGWLWSSQLGPEPGMPGCKCPPEILRKHGIDPATGLKVRQVIGRDVDSASKNEILT